MLFSLLFACIEGLVFEDKETGSGGGDDTGIEDIDDTETGDTGGDDTGGDDTGGDDTGEEPEGTTLTWEVEGDYAASAFSLVHIEFPLADGENFAMGAIWADAEAAATVSLEITEDPEDFYQELAPGLFLAAFLGALHEDDGDNRWEGDEGFTAVSPEFAIFLDGAIPPELLNAGLHNGWNAVLFEGESFSIGDPEAMPLPIALTETLTLAGTVDDTIEHDDRVVALPATIFAGRPVSSLMADVALPGDGTWSVTLDGAPPDDHFVDIDGDGVDEAVEFPVGYVDGDQSGGFNADADTVVSLACVDGRPIGGWWLAPPRDVVQLLSIQSAGYSLGWLPVLLAEDDGVIVGDEEAQSAVLSTACLFSD
ncbi:MAG: hypothetical protein FJ090_04065 [Deltaproteobacteria bacterium]|nr:hypothetical protein [Deltaproteobacteria bacterium]